MCCSSAAEKETDSIIIRLHGNFVATVKQHERGIFCLGYESCVRSPQSLSGTVSEAVALQGCSGVCGDVIAISAARSLFTRLKRIFRRVATGGANLRIKSALLAACLCGYREPCEFSRIRWESAITNAKTTGLAYERNTSPHRNGPVLSSARHTRQRSAGPALVVYYRTRRHAPPSELGIGLCPNQRCTVPFSASCPVGVLTDASFSAVIETSKFLKGVVVSKLAFRFLSILILP
jgi:hypothetical protein